MAASRFSGTVIRTSPILDGAESRTWSFPNGFASLLVGVFSSWHFEFSFYSSARRRSHLTQFYLAGRNVFA